MRCKQLTDKESIIIKYVDGKKKEKIEETIAAFDPLKNEKYAKKLTLLHQVLESELEVQKLLAIETNHCP